MIATALVFGLFLVGVVLLVLVTVLLVEILASFAKGRTPKALPEARPRMAVLVPAHDEAAVIAATIASLLPELSPSDRLIVIADNCTDDTAAIARVAGAEVIARMDPSRRGKGYALDFGARHLASDPPDVVIVIDADCTPDPGCLSHIARLAVATGRPVQAHYVLALPEGVRSAYLSVASFAWRVKNFARPLGCLRLGLACQLMGTGMAFPWPLFAKSDLATGEIVEDLVHGLELAAAGHPPLFYPDAVVTSAFPMARETQETQRARWETGHINTIVKRLPGLMKEAIGRSNYLLMAMVIDAAVPPLAFLAGAVVVFTASAAVAALLAGAKSLLVLAIVACLLFSIAVLLAWWRVGRDILTLYELILVPGYVLSKLGLYVRVLAGRKVEWIRSRRDAL